MSVGPDAPLSVTTPDDILVRGQPLSELIGRMTFTEMLLLDLTGEVLPSGRVRVVDAVLVAIAEHGITPSTLAARLVLDGAPEAMQGAVAAGLLATGSRFLGTVEPAATLLHDVVAGATGEPGSLAESAARHVDGLIARGERVPGLGHNLHADDDPRVAALLRVAGEEGVAGEHTEALAGVGRAATARLGRPLVVNAAGAIAAVLADLGFGADTARGFVLVARCAGLFAHVVDERRRPMARATWAQAHSTSSPGRPT